MIQILFQKVSEQQDSDLGKNMISLKLQDVHHHVTPII